MSCEHTWFPWRYCIIARKSASFTDGMVEKPCKRYVMQCSVKQSKLLLLFTLGYTDTMWSLWNLYCKPLRPLVAPSLRSHTTAQAFVVYIISLDSTSCPHNYYLPEIIEFFFTNATAYTLNQVDMCVCCTLALIVLGCTKHYCTLMWYTA